MRFESEQLPEGILSRLRYGARFATISSGEIEVRVPEGDYDWIITEIGFESAVDRAGLPPVVGRVFWRGYLEPPGELMLSPPRWRIGILSGVDAEAAATIPDDLWKITRIEGRGIYVGNKSALQRWWANLFR